MDHTVCASVPVDKILAALGMSEVPVACDLDPDGFVDIDVEVSNAEIISLGFIDSDDVPDEDEIAEDAIASLAPLSRDIADGLASLIAGDRRMAMILLSRAFDHWPEASRTIEECIRPMSSARPAVRVRVQLPLALT